METERVARALAEASSAMRGSPDIAGALTGLLASCQAGLHVDAGGILLASGGRLELMVASSHLASELEIHQLHADEGPCIEAYETSAPVQASSAEVLRERWPRFGETMVTAGFESVHAAPLGMQGQTFGAIGLFRRQDSEFTSEEEVISQAFADIASMLVVHLAEITPEQVSDRVQGALAARVLVEQAKGVLADTHGLSMADAYDLLIQSAHDRHKPLTAWASEVIHDARNAR